jgi:hypothetical protein
MKQQTAIQWLLEQIDDIYIHQVYDKKFKHAIELEKQQIIDAFEEGRKYPYEVGINHAEDYFNNTFQVK